MQPLGIEYGKVPTKRVKRGDVTALRRGRLRLELEEDTRHGAIAVTLPGRGSASLAGDGSEGVSVSTFSDDAHHAMFAGIDALAEKGVEEEFSGYVTPADRKAGTGTNGPLLEMLPHGSTFEEPVAVTFDIRKMVDEVRKTPLLRHVYIKTNTFPRQARDKHRENSKTSGVFRRRERSMRLLLATPARAETPTRRRSRACSSCCGRRTPTRRGSRWSRTTGQHFYT